MSNKTVFIEKEKRNCKYIADPEVIKNCGQSIKKKKRIIISGSSYNQMKHKRHQNYVVKFYPD